MNHKTRTHATLNWLALVLGLLCLAPPTLAGQGLPPEWIKDSKVPVLGYRVVNQYPHDRGAFTQGLAVADGHLLESTGLTGRSTVRRTEITTGRIVQQFLLAPEHFAEGLALHQNRIVQLTWKSGMGFVYDRITFAPLRTFHYRGEGWGITGDGKALIMSDGTAVLRLVHPDTFQQTASLTVRLGTSPLPRINELEMVEGEILANIWPTDYVARINPLTGQVTALIDLSGLLPAADRRADTDALNGIAYDSQAKRLFVTGKFWPKLFEIVVTGERADTGTR